MSTFPSRTFRKSLFTVRSRSSTREVCTAPSDNGRLRVPLLTIFQVVNINLLDTNDSLVDAWVRVWVISDFLVLKELQKEAINGLEKYCDEKVKALFEMVCDNKHKITRPKFEGHKVLLPQLFRGVETAYSQYPHSVPCQQVLVDFFYAVRAIMFRRAEFIRVVSKAPLQFSQELFIATIKGRVSRWTPEKVTDFHYTSRTGNCTFCKDPSEKHRESWSVDPSLSGVASSDKALSISWRCTPCVEKHGFDCVAADEENH